MREFFYTKNDERCSETIKRKNVGRRINSRRNYLGAQALYYKWIMKIILESPNLPLLEKIRFLFLTVSVLHMST